MRTLLSSLRAVVLAVSTLGLVALISSSAHADFLINPAGGTTLSGFSSAGTADVDDGSLLRSLGGTFSLYGTNLTSIYVNVNGFLSAVDGYGLYSDRTLASLANLVPGSVIAPYYDDLYLDTSVGNSIIEKVVSGSYYSATYTINGQTDITASAVARFQATLFTGNTSINGISYLPGDIVYTYSGLTNTVSNSNFSVGIAQNSTTSTPAFGATGGQFTTNTNFLSNFNPATQGILFRSTGGAYSQSLVNIAPVTVPETGTLAYVAIAALPLAGAIIRRRKAA